MKVLNKYDVQYENVLKNCQLLLKNERPFLKLPMFEISDIFRKNSKFQAWNIGNFKNEFSILRICWQLFKICTEHDIFQGLQFEHNVKKCSADILPFLHYSSRPRVLSKSPNHLPFIYDIVDLEELDYVEELSTEIELLYEYLNCYKSIKIKSQRLNMTIIATKFT